MARPEAVFRVFGLCLALVRLCCGTGDFLPFAGLDELKPRGMEEFCSGEEAGNEGGRRLRWCRHSVRAALEDGGDVELAWRMRVDPDAVLSLDTETGGARALSCSPGALELELPKQRAERLAPGHLVLASRFAHGCGHLDEGHLYGRVREVKLSRPEGGAGGAGTVRTRLTMEELPSFAHAVPSLDFHFSYMPVEARTHVKFPEMRTDFGSNRDFLQKKRRLMDSPFHVLDRLKELAKVKGLQEDDGGFKQGARSATSVQNENSILHFQPKQLSNFGWNWNFFMNTTESPNYDITLPGAEGIVKVRKPYVKMHSGIYLNFSSEFVGLTTPPKVKWTLGAHGHGYFQARILAQMNTTASAKVDPFATKVFTLPLLESLSVPQWFQKVDMALGPVPLSIEPGFQFNARMYHSGTFHGAMAVGGKTHGVFNPTLSFDSLKGFDATMQATLLDTDLWPPFWMIFTKRFELGVMFQPSILLRGDFAGLKKSTVAIDMHPYLNITISREDEAEPQIAQVQPQQGGGAGLRPPPPPAVAEPPAPLPHPDDGLRRLTVYPMRAMGLNASRRYKVRIDTNGKVLSTKPQMSWGQVSFHDHVSNFDAGRVSEKAAIAQSIIVTLIEVDDNPSSPTTTVLGWGEVRCSTFKDGKCSESPTIARIKSGKVEVAAVELAILWDDAPEMWFASQLRGAAVSVPEVVLRGDAQSLARVAGANSPQVIPSDKLTLRFVHLGITYMIPLAQGAHSQLPTYTSDTVTQLGPGFLQDWLPCKEEAGAKCESSRLELYLGSVQVASANLPQIDWTSQLAAADRSGSFLAASNSGHNAPGVPVMMPLYATGNVTESIAVVKMSMRLTSPISSSLFLKPSLGKQMPVGGFPQDFVWTLEDVDEEREYAFTLTVLKKTDKAFAPPPAYPLVHGQALEPVPGSRFELHLRCRRRATAGLPAAEAPCSFGQALAFGERQHAAGEQAVVLVQWKEAGASHSLLSPAFELVEAPQPVSARRLWSKDAWNARVNSHEGCKERHLRFRLGAGMLVRGRIDHLGLPDDLPTLGNLGDQEPALSTGYRKIAAVKPGTDARDLLPEELCKGGLCKGALPGCREASFKKMHFPIIHLNFSRHLHYAQHSKGKLHGLVKEAVAYAFSTLPEALDVMIHKFNETSRAGHGSAATTTVLPGALHAAAEGPPPTTPRPLPPAALPAARPAESTTKAPYFKKWWAGLNRRLQGEDEQREEWGRPQEEEHHVTVRFKHGVPFVIDRPLVNMMLQHGYFMEVEDDASPEQGPLHITSFHIEGGGVAATESRGGEAATGAASPRSSTGAGALAGSLGVLALLATAVILPRKRRKYAAAAPSEVKAAE